jgi:hypothetical protein
LTGCSFGEARKTLGVDVGVAVGSSKRVSADVGVGMGVETLAVGGSNVGVIEDAGVPAV